MGLYLHYIGVILYISIWISESWSARLLPGHLEDCYQQPAPALLPRTIHTMVEIINKITLNSNTPASMAQQITDILNWFCIDGLERDPNVVLTQINVIPYHRTGFQAIKQDLLFDELIPMRKRPFDAYSLSTSEKCTLHFMVSSAVDPWERGDEYRVCPNSFTTFRNSSSPARLSSCPLEHGAVETPGGTVSMGRVLTGVAAALSPQLVTLGQLPSPQQLSTPSDTISNVWAATLAGNLAEVSVFQNQQYNTDITIGLYEQWNDTIIPTLLYFSNVPYSIIEKRAWQMTNAQILGGIDGLLLGRAAVKFRLQMPELRLAQLLEMYYLRASPAEPHVCHRVTTFNTFIRENRQMLITQTQNFATLLTTRATTYFIDKGVLRYRCLNAVEKFIRYYPQVFGREQCPMQQVFTPRLNLVTILDATWPPYTRLQFLMTLAEEADINYYGGTITIINGDSRHVRVNSTNSPISMYQQMVGMPYRDLAMNRDARVGQWGSPFSSFNGRSGEGTMPWIGITNRDSRGPLFNPYSPLDSRNRGGMMPWDDRIQRDRGQWGSSSYSNLDGQSPYSSLDSRTRNGRILWDGRGGQWTGSSYNPWDPTRDSAIQRDGRILGENRIGQWNNEPSSSGSLDGQFRDGAMQWNNLMHRDTRMGQWGNEPPYSLLDGRSRYSMPQWDSMMQRDGRGAQWGSGSIYGSMSGDKLLNKYKLIEPNELVLQNSFEALKHILEFDNMREKGLQFPRRAKEDVALVLGYSSTISDQDMELATDLLKTTKEANPGLKVVYWASRMNGHRFVPLTELPHSHSDQIISTDSSRVEDVTPQLQAALYSARSLKPAYCKYDNHQWPESMYVDYISPGQTISYWIHPAYLCGSLDIVKTTFMNYDYGELYVCMSRSAQEPGECRSVGPRQEVTLTVTRPCEQHGLLSRQLITSGAQQWDPGCRPIYYTVTAKRAYNKCTEYECRYLDQIKFSIVVQDLHCIDLNSGVCSAALSMTVYFSFTSLVLTCLVILTSYL